MTTLEPNPKGIKHFTKGNKINHRRLEEGEKNKLEKKKNVQLHHYPIPLLLVGGWASHMGTETEPF